MTDLEDGKYWIVNAASPKPWSGIIIPEYGKPVVAEGKITVWNLLQLDDGNYTLTLENDGKVFPAQDDNGKLVVNEAASEWIIEGPDNNGLYTIRALGDCIPPKAWTVNDPKPESPVTLDLLDILQPKQKWNFISWWDCGK